MTKFLGRLRHCYDVQIECPNLLYISMEGNHFEVNLREFEYYTHTVTIQNFEYSVFFFVQNSACVLPYVYMHSGKNLHIPQFLLSSDSVYMGVQCTTLSNITSESKRWHKEDFPYQRLLQRLNDHGERLQLS